MSLYIFYIRYVPVIETNKSLSCCTGVSLLYKCLDILFLLYRKGEKIMQKKKILDQNFFIYVDQNMGPKAGRL